MTNVNQLTFSGNNRIFNGKIRSALREKVEIIREEAEYVIRKNPDEARTATEALLTSPSVQAILAHKAAEWLHDRNLPVAAKIVSNVARIWTGISIHPEAKLGKRVLFNQIGAKIGRKATIGNDVVVNGDASVVGSILKGHLRGYPTIGDNVTLGRGCKIIGSANIGEGSKIGVDSVVINNNVPTQATIVGNPPQIIEERGNKLNPPRPLQIRTVNKTENL